MSKRKDTALSQRDTHSSGGLLERILATPHLSHVVPRLQPEVLHRLIRHCGLEDCGPLVALTTPDQLARVFDLDLWRPAAPGRDEQFDADRFGLWLDVMVDADLPGAAAMVAAMDPGLIAAGLAQHVRVFDYAAVAPFVTLDGDVSPGRELEGLRCEVGGFAVQAKGTEFWDAITAIMNAMAEAHGDAFSQIMRACCRLSYSRPEIDGLDDLLVADEQAMLDRAVEREARRDTQGYVTPADARAFLQTSRRIDLRGGAMPPRDAITRAYFGNMEVHAEPDSNTPALPVRDDLEPVLASTEEAVAAVVDLLHDAGVLPRVPRGLLEAPHTGAPRLARIQALMQFAHHRDPAAYAARNAELAYLANVIVAGTSIQARPVSRDEASNAVVAVCNLGLEKWPVQWLPELPEDFLIHHDLVSVFQAGWTVLHEDVCMYSADALIRILTSVRCADSDAQAAVRALRASLIKHSRAGAPWRSRAALDVIAILDAPSWAALLGLIDELPTLHGAVGALLSSTTRRIDPSAFEFISEPSQIQQVHQLMEMLPAALCG